MLRGLLATHGLGAAKRLGQHFLVSDAVVEAIVGRCPAGVSVLEVGPGPGVLTSRLSSGRSLIAVEFDARLKPVLEQTAPDARMVWADALRLDLRALLLELEAPRCIVSNMPYNITGPLLTRFADLADSVGRLILMMQREVATKVLAQPGQRDRGSLSVDLQSRFLIEKVADAPSGAFWPPPKVDSTVLQFIPRPEQPHRGLPGVLRAGFSQPRKTLANNLSSGLGVPRERVVGWIESLGLPSDVRAQVLDVAQWDRVRACASEDGS